ncbi:MAG: ABC transporter permease subunit [Luteolibacter sp.]|jgi:Cu-processing system permease protein|nr:ABC transporter permease subunit [Luteolibacter sp.]
MLKIVRYVLQDIIRSRIIIAYTLILLAASFGLFNLGGDVSKGLIGLLSLIMLVVPLVCLIFGTIHFYNSYEFIELLASQPLKRRTILLGEFLGVAGALCGALLLGIGLPVLLYAAGATGFTLLAVGVVLTLVFVALAFLGAVATRDKARGVGMAMLIWFYFALLHGGLMLLIMFAFEDYPLEKPTMAMIALNPIDLGRVVVLLQMDVSALMGYTGALMKDLLGTASGISSAAGILLLWILIPLGLALWIFRRKDL